MTRIPLPLAPGLAALVLLATCGSPPGDEVKAVELFDGETLDSWTNHGGGRFYVEDGAIVGEAAPGFPNSFLATDARYGDFELEAEFQVDPLLNSGIQIRSDVYPEETKTIRWNGRFREDGSRDESERTWEKGRFWGYQVEIDPSDRAWTGALYEEGGRGYLHAPEASSAYRPGEWNRLRVVARGSRIRTWLNGEPIADLEDDLTASGHIALQLHGIGNNEEKAGRKIRFRNLVLREPGP